MENEKRAAFGKAWTMAGEGRLLWGNGDGLFIIDFMEKIT
jgi:hypothetical protein